MNGISMLLFVIFCIHSLSCHSNAQSDGGALSVVHTEENDNGKSFLEVLESTVHKRERAFSNCVARSERRHNQVVRVV